MCEKNQRTPWTDVCTGITVEPSIALCREPSTNTPQEAPKHQYVVVSTTESERAAPESKRNACPNRRIRTPSGNTGPLEFRVELVSLVQLTEGQEEALLSHQEPASFPVWLHANHHSDQWSRRGPWPCRRVCPVGTHTIRGCRWHLPKVGCFRLISEYTLHSLYSRPYKSVSKHVV